MFLRQLIVQLFLFVLVSSGVAQFSNSLRSKIDDIVTTAIREEAFPGCVVYAARKGNPFFVKAYGFHTYDSLLRVTPETIYDLASITKVTASTLCLMKLYEDNVLDIDASISDYIDDLGNQVSKLTIREMLVHQSGLPPGLRFHTMIRQEGGFQRKTLSYVQTLDYNWRVGRSLYAYHDLYPVLKEYISEVEVSEDRRFRYSGLFFYLVPELVYNLTGKSFRSYLNENFYQPMGAETITFNAGREFEDYEIAPTEIDTVFRMELIHGTVHDEGAALMRGVSGNAGLFSNAADLAKVWQMFLNDGVYNGRRYLEAATINHFTSVQYPNNANHRGLGFDKIHSEYNPELSHYAPSASIRSYGHYGYTGTMVWADPDEDLLFILLSNRVYPYRSHGNLRNMRIRPLLHEAMYDFIAPEEESDN